MSVLLSKMCLGQIQNLKNTQSTEIKKKTFVSKNHTKTWGKKLHKNTIGTTTTWWYHTPINKKSVQSVLDGQLYMYTDRHVHTHADRTLYFSSTTNICTYESVLIKIDILT